MSTATMSRIESLREFRERLQRADSNSDDQFHELFRDCQTILELSDQQIADEIKVTRPTVNRWAHGQNLPHRALRPYLVKWMDAQVLRKIKFHETSRGGGGTLARGASMVTKGY